MPRVAFTPDPINFGDDPTERIMGPIRQNMMSLAQTFATDVPQIRMHAQAQQHQQDMQDAELQMRRDAVKTDQSRYDSRQTLLMQDRAARDSAAMLGPMQGLLDPQGAAPGGAGRGASHLSTGEQAPGMSEKDQKYAEARLDRLFQQERSAQPKDAAQMEDYEVDAQGNPIDLLSPTLDPQRAKTFKSRPAMNGNAEIRRKLTAEEERGQLEDARLRAYRTFDTGQPLSQAEVAALRRSGYDVGGGNGYDAPVGGEGGSSPNTTAYAPSLRMTPGQLVEGRRHFAMIRAKAESDPAWAAQNGIDAYRLQEMYQQLWPQEAQAAPAPAQEAPPVEAPSLGDPAGDSLRMGQPPVAPTAPAGAQPPTFGVERTDTAGALNKQVVEGDAILRGLLQRSYMDPDRSHGDLRLNAPADYGMGGPLDEAGIREVFNRASNPAGLPDWLFPDGQAPEPPPDWMLGPAHWMQRPAQAQSPPLLRMGGGSLADQAEFGNRLTLAPTK